MPSLSAREYLNNGNTARAAGDLGEADRQYSRVVRMTRSSNPTNIQARLMQGVCCNMVGRSREAQLLLVPLLDEDLTTCVRGAVLRNLGEAYRVGKDLDKAEEYIDQSVETLRNCGALDQLAVSIGYRGRLLFTRARYEKALEDFFDAGGTLRLCGFHLEVFYNDVWIARTAAHLELGTRASRFAKELLIEAGKLGNPVIAGRLTAIRDHATDTDVMEAKIREASYVFQHVPDPPRK